MTRAPRPPMSLGRLATVALVSAIASLLVGTAIIWVGFVRLLDARERVFEQMEPALNSSLDLRASVLDQETGLRGYALTRDRRLLAPYRGGLAAQDEADATLRRQFHGDPLEDDIYRQLDRVIDAMERWRKEAADPILDQPVDAEASDAIFLAAKESFDRVRSELLQLEALLQQERGSARAELDRTTMRLFTSIGVTLGLLGLVTLLGSWILRRQVVAPIEQLVEAADDVAADRLDRPIDVEGPGEIERLALRVSEMRDRILQELAVVEAARRDLDRQALELARSNDDLEQFAYVASHDLQEPLRKVASFCQLLEQRYGDQLDERGHSYIEFAVDGAKRMQALISDLLEFSRLGRSTDSFVPCDLEALAVEVAAQHGADLDGGAIEIGDLPTVLGDPTLLRQLLHNLIGNAVKYRRVGAPVEVALRAELDGDQWQLSCADRGIGIEAPYRDRVFVIFQRLHGRDEFDGTGIGLALCRKIVEFSGGRIWIDEPTDGVGTVVRWTLPALDAGSTATGSPSTTSGPR